MLDKEEYLMIVAEKFLDYAKLHPDFSVSMKMSLIKSLLPLIPWAMVCTSDDLGCMIEDVRIEG